MPPAVIAFLVKVAISVVISVALSFISKALAPKPKRPNLQNFTDRETGIKQIVRNSVEPRRVIYGERLVSGPLVYVTTAGTDNKFVHLIIVLMHGAAESIGEIQFNEEIVGTLDSGGNVTSGRFSGKARIKKHLGEDDQAADADLVGDVGDWTTDHQLKGLTYIYVRLEFDRDVYPTGIPNIKAIVKGKRLYDTRSVTTSITSSSVANPTVIAAGAVHNLVPGNRVFIKNHTGSTPAIAGEHQVIATPSTTTFTININVTVGGTGGTFAKMLWSDNSALALQDFLVSSHGLKADAITEVDSAAVTTAANICDEEVNLSTSIPTFPFIVDDATDILTQGNPGGNEKFKAIHPGDGVQLTTTDTLPAGLALATTYFVIYLTESTFKLAKTLVDARQATLGDELVTNGAFATDTDWTKGTGWTIASGVATKAAGVAADLEQNQTLTNGDSYDVTFTITAVTAGTVTVRLAGTLGTARSTAATFTETIFAGAGGDPKLEFVADSAFAGSIDVVSVKRRAAIDITDSGTGTHTLTLKTQPRYTTNGVLLLDERPIDIVPNLTQSMFGSVIYTQGKYVMFAGAFTGPASIALNESNLRAGIEWLTRPSKKDLHNGVKGVFVDRDNLWATTEFPTVLNASFETLDGGERILKDVEMAFITDSLRAQRLAKLTNERNRQSLTVKYPCNLTALQIAVMDVVDVTNSRLGWSSKEFEVLEWILTEKGGIDLVLKETAAGVYTFDPDADTTFVDLAPNTNLPDPFTIQPPTALLLTSGTANLFLKADGTVVSRIKATWTAAADSFVELYEVQFKKTADATFEPAGFTSADTLQIFIFDVEDGVNYTVRVRSISHLQVRSDVTDPWSATATHTVVGKTAPPTNVASLTAQQNGNVVVFKWPQVADLDLAGYEIRFGPQATSTFVDATPLTEVTRGTQITTAAVPPGTHKFHIKARDTSGNFSVASADANLTVANQNDVIISQQHDPDYPLGILVNMLRHWTGKLVLDDQDLASGNNFNVFNTYVQSPFTTSSYEAPEIDLGFDAKNVRVFAEIDSVLGPGETTGTADPVHEVSFRNE